ncbi:MAG: hypothetical protein ABIU54_14270 [Candidatus Eisenbacteria bacterium]
MRLAPRVGLLIGFSVLAAAGLLAPGLLGLLGSYVWLGVFPGMAIVRLLLPRASTMTRWTIGLALAPLVSSLLGVALLMRSIDLQTGARLIGISGWLLFAGGESRGHAHSVPEDTPPADRWVWLLTLAACAFVAIPLLSNEWIRVHSDGLTHAALVWEIVLHGIPPMDPRFIGLQLNYVWVYNFFIAQLTSLRGQDLFSFMAIMNVVDIGIIVWVVWQLTWAVWGTRRAAQGAVIVLLTGMNAGAYLLWPLQLVRVLQGDVKGWAELKRIVGNIRLDNTEVVYELRAPLAHMVMFFDKFTLGTPIGYAWLMLLLHFLALARWLESGNARWLLVSALCAAGMQLFHGVVGMSVVPVTTGAVLLTAFLSRRFSWLPPARGLVGFGAAVLAGFIACIPYTRSISKGWDPQATGVRHSFLHFTGIMPWTLLTACGVAFALALPAMRRILRERRPLGTWFVVWVAGMTLFAMIVHLPESNEHKFVWPILSVLAILGGASLWPAMDAVRRRTGPVVLGLGFAAVFLVPPALTLRGYVLDRGAGTSELLGPLPGEDAFYTWLRDSTRTDVVVIDHRSRYVVNIKGQRRLLAGTPFGSERAAFPAADLARRRALTDDLFGPVADLSGDLATLDSVRTQALRLHSVTDLLILYRPGDFGPGQQPWQRLEQAAGERVRLRYDHDGFRLYQLVP